MTSPVHAPKATMNAKSLPSPLATLGRSVQRVLGWLGCLLLMFAVPAGAQPTASVWIGAGLGPGMLFDGDQAEEDVGGSFSGVAYASYQSGIHVFSLRTATSGELLFGDNFLDVGLLYGRARTGVSRHASVSVGVALVIGERRCDGFLFLCSSEDGVEFADDLERVVTVGLPIEAQLLWRPALFGGFGLYGFANLNPEASFVGATLGFQLGAFR